MNAAQLKASILQQAIEGKLVPQLPEEGVAEQIGDAPSEVPFEIPESWKWVQISNIGTTSTGTTPPTSNSEYYGHDIPFIKPGDIVNNSITYRADGLSNKSRAVARILPKYSILMVCIGGSIGKTAMCDREISFNQQINAIICDFNYLHPKYILSAFMSVYFQGEVWKAATGTATPIIKKSRWERLWIPLPPLAEQKRIVAKIEELMPLVEEYGKAYDKLQELNDELPDKLKASILQEAIQGKLVPQLPDDGVVEQIGEAQAEVPFEIPASWKWVTLDNCVFVNPKITQREDEIQATFLPMASVSAGFVNQYSIADKKPWGKIKNGFTRFENNDVLMAKITPCFQNRKSCIVTNLENGIGAGSTEFFVLRTKPIVQPDYILWFVKSKFFIDYGISNLKGTAGQLRVGSTSLKNCLIPLPPLAEQKRIVAKIEALFEQIDLMTN